MNGCVVAVEGNIAAGKSTLCGQLSEIMGAEAFLEPSVDNPYLKKFYGDPGKYALTMQVHTLMTRFATYLRALDMAARGKTVLLDRCVHSDIVFASENHRIGNISDSGFRLYASCRDRLTKALPLPNVVLHLACSPKTCHSRIKRVRCIECESGISVEYLRGLSAEYAKLMKRMREQKCRVVEVDWNSFGDCAEVASRIRGSLVSGGVRWSDDLSGKAKEVGQSVKRCLVEEYAGGELHFDDSRSEGWKEFL